MVKVWGNRPSHTDGKKKGIYKNNFLKNDQFALGSPMEPK